MKPKEKAEVLYHKYLEYQIQDINLYGYAKDRAKLCALIAVDEIIKALDDDIYIQGETDINSFINSWKEVKHEIEKL